MMKVGNFVAGLIGARESAMEIKFLSNDQKIERVRISRDFIDAVTCRRKVMLVSYHMPVIKQAVQAVAGEGRAWPHQARGPCLPTQ